MAMFPRPFSFILALAAAVGLSACGERSLDDKPQGPVRGLDLSTGQQKDFASADEIPPGWAACRSESCHEALADVPCANLGESVCTNSPQCRLKQTGCQGSGESCPEGAPCTTEPPPPPRCDYACLPKTPLLCEELDAAACAVRSDCELTELCPAAPCPPGGPCPPMPCSQQCMQKAPPPCEQLGEQQCATRTECAWEAKPCLFWCEAGDPSCACGTPFCQDKADKCPTLTPPGPDLCAEGKLVPRYDENGCAVGWDCHEETCPPIPPYWPECPAETELKWIKDDKGCTIGHECAPLECQPTTEPAPVCPEGTELVVEKSPNGCVTGYACQPTDLCPEPVLPPCGPGENPAKKIDAQGCEYYVCDTQPSTCAELSAAYQQALAEAKTCYPTASPLPQCSVSVWDQLACPCSTFVNPANTAAIDQLEAYKKEWTQRGCAAALACPAVVCFTPKSGTCSVTMASGAMQCADNS